MSLWEWLANVVSIVVFATLTYKMLLIVLSLPSRLRLLDRIKLAMQQRQCEYQRHHDLMRSGTGSIQDSALEEEEQAHRTFAPFAPNQMIRQVVRLRMNRDYHGADRVFANWMDQVSLGYAIHNKLAYISIIFGTIGTIVGIVIALEQARSLNDLLMDLPRIASATFPFAAGLFIAILVKLSLSAFAGRVDEVRRYALCSIDNIIQMTTSLPLGEPANVLLTNLNDDSTLGSHFIPEYWPHETRTPKSDVPHVFETSGQDKHQQTIVGGCPQLAIEVFK